MKVRITRFGKPQYAVSIPESAREAMNSCCTSPLFDPDSNAPLRTPSLEHYPLSVRESANFGWIDVSFIE